MLIYDIEIAKAIPQEGEERIKGIEYCEGWHDHANMGVGCIGAFDYETGRNLIFYQDNFYEWWELVNNRRPLVGFSNIAFDNAVLRAEGLIPEYGMSYYDISVEVWAACGLQPPYDAATHAGYGLNAMCDANFGIKKTGNGASAPIWFQTGKIGYLTNYCLNDIFLTKMLLDRIMATGELKNPKTGEPIKVRKPF